jgi:hypothetical protein
LTDFHKNRLIEKTFQKIDMIKLMENYQKSINSFNSYGLKKHQKDKENQKEHTEHR